MGVGGKPADLRPPVFGGSVMVMLLMLLASERFLR